MASSDPSRSLASAARLLARWAAILVVASAVVFAVVRMMPTTPVQQLLTARQLPATPENVSALEHAWGLDLPLPEQYLSWASNFLRGDWGTSMVSRLDIRDEFLSKLPYTLLIGLGGTALGAFASFWLGFVAALRPRGLADRLSRALAVLVQTVPQFIVAMVIIYVIGVRLRAVRFFSGSGVPGLVAATAIIAVFLAGSLSRVVAVRFLEQMSSAHVRFALSRGWSRSSALLRHGWRPVAIPLVSLVVARVPAAIGGSSVLEFAFTIPGISYFLIESMQAKDYYVLQSYVMVIVLVMFVVHAVADALMALLGARGRS